MQTATTVALTGNLFLAQPINRNQNERFLRVVDLLRAADVTLTNLECSIPKSDQPPAYMAGMGWAATYMVGTAEMLDDLKYLGIDGVCAANNHVADFGEAGILSTISHLKRARLPYAGIGASMSEATDAGYVETPTGLRVAFIAVCDWGPRGSLGLNFPWPAGYLPSDDAPPFRPRPGVNLLRYDVVSHVTLDQLNHLRRISGDLGWEPDKIYRRNGFNRAHPLVGLTTNLGAEIDSDTEFYFMGRKFQASQSPGYHTVPCQEDLDRLYKHIREARRQADIVCVALHDQSHGERVHDYVDIFAHGAIEAGADIYFNNGGTHMGIEIYKEKAIIYGIPSFFLQTEAVTHVPSSEMARFQLAPDSTAADFLDKRAEGTARAFEEAGQLSPTREGARGSAVHLCVFDQKARLREIRIQPLEPLGGTVFALDQNLGVPRFRKQLPMMPDPGNPVVERVLRHASEMSKPFGTKVEIHDGVGVVTFE